MVNSRPLIHASHPDPRRPRVVIGDVLPCGAVAEATTAVAPTPRDARVTCEACRLAVSRWRDVNGA
jgi:hypothetical protein